MNIINKEITETRSSINFKLTTTDEVTSKEASDWQAEHSVHPAGYGFYGFKCELRFGGTYESTWSCSSSCD